MLFTVVVVVIASVAFDFTNGFHDTANAMATSIATGALRPRIAVGISALLNLLGAFLSVQVAKTISGGIVNDHLVTPQVILGGLVGAFVWNLLTWRFGMPSSSSHALIGGLIGATWVASGGSAVRFGSVVEKVVIPAVLSPLIAGTIAMIGTYAVYRITRVGVPEKTAGWFRHGQVISASLVSLAHGTNDAQKTMGIITLTLIAGGYLPASSGPPLWVIFTSGLAIGIGTYVGGWRIIRTVGQRITDVGPQQGFAAETAAATVILASTHLGYALSTTQVASGAVIGSGLGRAGAPHRVRWSIVGEMVSAWVLTLPLAGLMGAGAGEISSKGRAGQIVVIVIAAVVAVGIYLWSRSDPVTARSVGAEAAAKKPEPEPVRV